MCSPQFVHQKLRGASAQYSLGSAQMPEQTKHETKTSLKHMHVVAHLSLLSLLRAEGASCFAGSGTDDSLCSEAACTALCGAPMSLSCFR